MGWLSGPGNEPYDGTPKESIEPVGVASQKLLVTWAASGWAVVAVAAVVRRKADPNATDANTAIHVATRRTPPSTRTSTPLPTGSALRRPVRESLSV